MAKRTWDETDEVPTVTALDTPEEGVSAPELPIDGDDAETVKLRAEMATYQEAFYDIQNEDTPSGQQERNRLRSLMRKTQKLLDAKEELVEVLVPRSPTGQFYHIGTRTFGPGRVRVRKGVAQMLLWAIQNAQQAEVNMMRQNGRQIDLTPLMERARNFDIMADN